MRKKRLSTDDDAAPGDGAAIEGVPGTRQAVYTNEYKDDMIKKRRVGTETMADEHGVVLMAGRPGSKRMPDGLVSASDHRHDMDIPELGQMHVLVIDSERESRLKTVGLLQECGYKVLICSRGSAAFEMLVREFDKGVSVDVILKAHEPPVSSAVDFLERLRSSHKEYTNILVIVYSDRCDDRDAMAECLSLGAVDWWVKPLRRNEVCNIWTRVWQQKHAGQLTAKNAGGLTEKERGNDASSVLRLAEHTPMLEQPAPIVDGDVHHHHHRHHHHRRYHHHRDPEGDEEELPLASEATAVPARGDRDLEMAPGHGSSAKQSGTIPTKKSAVGAAKPPIKKNESSNPSVKSAAADLMDAEVAAALTSMRSHRSNESSDDKHIAPKDAANMATGKEQVIKTEDGSGGSTQFGMQSMMSMPFMPGHPVMNYRQYPFPWPPGNDASKQNLNEGKAQRQAMDFQQAWFNWQQQYHAMQMNYAMQGAQRPFAGNWPPMNVPYSYGGWTGSSVSTKYQKPTFSDASGSRQMASPAMSDSTRSQLARLEAVKKYKEKRTRRKADTSTKIRYKSRKILADARPRVRGQFVQLAKQASSEQGSNRKNKNESSEQAYHTKDLGEEDKEQRVQARDCDMPSASDDKTTNNNDASVPSQSGRPLASKGGPSDSGSNSPQSRQE